MDRWQEITRILHAALTRVGDDRRAFLDDACAGDPELRRQVEALLRVDSSAAGSPERVAPASAATVAPRALLISGERLAHYTIRDKIGQGGMGEVYRARDEQLDRDVAIKVLPADNADAQARERLVREARAAAALNHPHICTVHEVGEASGQAYIAMEFVEGQTLGAALENGALPVEQIFRFGIQLADALAHAHERGVVHRDLKSANVIVTPDGRVKVLDFGLARRLTTSELSVAVTQVDATFTQPGAIMGTLAYMAPEQLRGQTAHAPSDVWALGIVLHEMASGVRPFQGQTGFELSAAVLNQPPAPLPSSVPANLQAVIGRCLEKEPGARYKSGSEVRAALEAIRTGGTDRRPTPDAQQAPVAHAAAPIVTVTVTRRRALWLGVAAIAAAAVGFAAWRLMTRGDAPVQTMAVLPFENRLQDDDFDYLCDGIAESLIQQVSRLASFRVRPLTSVLPFKGRTADPQSAGRQLGVETILAGTLEVSDARLRISARLLDVATGRQLWSSDYDRGSADLLNIQDEIAAAIMDDGLRVQLTSAERQQLVRHPTTDGDAYDLYLQARFVQRRATEEDYLYSRELLERAIVRDPKFTLAYAALAGNYAMMLTDGLERPTDAWPMANKYMRQALSLDPTLPAALAIEHAVAFLFDWDWAGAERVRRRFMEAPIGDFDPQSLRAMSTELWAIGKLDEALQVARRTRELDPASPYLAVLEADYLMLANRLDESVAVYQHAIRLEPDNPNAHFGLAEALFRQKRFDEAIDARRRAHELAGDDGLKELLSTARGEPGYKAIEQAWIRLQLDALKARAAAAYVSPLDLARAYAQLGERELAFKYLDAAFTDRAPGLVFLKVDRAWDSVRDDPRFGAAVQRVGLP
jgi:TolB-like protein/aminoglycoside phosphotransferase (APT) family kinase protein